MLAIRLNEKHAPSRGIIKEILSIVAMKIMYKDFKGNLTIFKGTVNPKKLLLDEELSNLVAIYIENHNMNLFELKMSYPKKTKC